MKNHFKTDGIILRKVDLNEADRIVTVLSRDYGKISCLAKGCRRLKSKFCGRLELFSSIRLTGFKGRNLNHLNEAELICGHALLDTPLQHKKTLFYMAEITNKLIQEDQQIEGAYSLLVEVLDHFQKSADSEVILYVYLIKLLTLLGFMAPWDRCARSNKKLDINEPLFLSAIDASVIRSGYNSSADLRLSIPMVKWVNFMQKYPLSASLKVATTKGQRLQVWHLLQTISQNIFSTPLKAEEFLRMTD